MAAPSPNQTGNSAPPTDQRRETKAIGFYLVDRSQNHIKGSDVILNVRPEELTHSFPSRINPQQTLGSTVWADTFGPGMPTINISGHTGWRRPLKPSLVTDDGVTVFSKLKDTVFDRWHSLRAIALSSGLDPAREVQLIFADLLDGYISVVAPMSFILRRSKTRPLLMQYQISMAVLSEELTDQVLVPDHDPMPPGSIGAVQAGITSMNISIASITAQVKNIQQYVDQSITAPVRNFMLQTAGIFNAVQGAVNSVGAVTNSLITVGRLAAQSGVYIFRSLAAVAGLPSLVKANLMEIAGAYSNCFCILKNVFNKQLVYEDYSPLYGSSNCSSTSGGRPPSALGNVNPFASVAPPQPTSQVLVSQTAQTTMQGLVSGDSVLTPTTIQAIGVAAGTIGNGIALS